MKVAVCRAWGDPGVLHVEEFPSAPLAAGHVRLEVRAAGIGFHDMLMVAGKYQHRPPFPACPGSEVCGVVREVGAGVASLRVGDKVVAMMSGGGFADEATVPEGAAVKIAPETDDVAASVIAMAYGTAYQGFVDSARVKPGETVLVRGAAGGLGIAAVQLARAIGATVIAAAGTPERRALAREHGAHHVIDSNAPDFRDSLFAIAGGPVDVIYDTVGGGNFREAVLRTINWRGRILIVGFAGGEIPQIPAHYILNKFCSVMSVWWGRSSYDREPEIYRTTLHRLFEMHRAGLIKPFVSRVCSLETVPDVLADIAANRLQGRAAIAF